MLRQWCSYRKGTGIHKRQNKKQKTKTKKTTKNKGVLIERTLELTKGKTKKQKTKKQKQKKTTKN